MKSFLFQLVLIVVFLFFNRCSWVQEFLICNELNEDAYVTYILESQSGSFPVFDNQPNGYYLNKNGKVQTDKRFNFIDADSSALTVTTVIPPFTALVIGYLHNDNYKQYNQKFINNRVFNLSKLIIRVNGNTTVITPPTFDTYFQAHKGTIYYRLK